jgi:hypothetical protein
MGLMRAGWILAAMVVGVAAGAYVYVASGKATPPLAQTLEAVASSAVALATAVVPSLAPEAGPEVDAAEMPHRQSAPLSNTQLGAPLVHGTFLGECGAPDAMHVTLKVNVKFGRATSVDVKTTPPDTTIAACIERAVRDKQWDVSPHPGKVTVTY